MRYSPLFDDQPNSQPLALAANPSERPRTDHSFGPRAAALQRGRVRSLCSARRGGAYDAVGDIPIVTAESRECLALKPPLSLLRRQLAGSGRQDVAV